jgi:cytosine/uracil/thiamine/allantoin permease
MPKSDPSAGAPGSTESKTPAQLAHSHEQVAHVVKFNLPDIKRRVSEVEGFNAKLAVIITSGVGTMACAYAFAALALVSLPDALRAGRPQIVSWVAQTFLQLVLLSIIMVGQRVQSAASDIRANKQFVDTEEILDRLDTKTAGGITDVLDAIKHLDKPT